MNLKASWGTVEGRMMHKRLRNPLSHIHQQTCIHLHNLFRMKKSHILLPVRHKKKSRILLHSLGENHRTATSCYRNHHDFLHKEIRDKPEFGTHLIRID